MTTGWSIYVIVLVTFNIVGVAALLMWTAKRRPGDPKPTDTSHIWDGDVTEYNKPLPRWWMILFWMTIIFAVGYLVWYPGFGNFKGVSKWTSAAEHDQQKKLDDAKIDTAFAPYKGMSIDQIAKDPTAVKMGRAIFANNCATCHGSSGKGATNGYPNLTDNIWKWGGKPEDILTSIQQGREGLMTPWGTVLTGMGGPSAVDAVAAYVRTLSNPELLKNNYMASQGKAMYEGVCVACHGKEGKGNQAIGAPDLTDHDWLYGDSTAAIRETIQNGRHGIMPPHLPLLGDTRTRVVGAYVWSISHSTDASGAH